MGQIRVSRLFPDSRNQHAIRDRLVREPTEEFFVLLEFSRRLIIAETLALLTVVETSGKWKLDSERENLSEFKMRKR